MPRAKALPLPVITDNAPHGLNAAAVARLLVLTAGPRLARLATSPSSAVPASAKPCPP